MITSVKEIKTISAFNILECDGENLQARIATSMSKDPALRKLFLGGGDFHSNNAYEIMAKYMKFIPYEITFEDGTTKEIMEWESFDLQRGKHISVKQLEPNDEIFSKKIKQTKSLEPRAITMQEFCSNAKKGVLKDIRTVSKFIGFGFIFGMSAVTFASSTLRIVWTIPRCEEFILSMGLSKLKKTLEAKYKYFNKDELIYLTVATFFRDEFFKLYPVLEKWILSQGATATKQGYIRSPWGSRRLLPQLVYQGKDSDTREVKNLSNIAVNSPVQDYETVYMAKAMIGVNKLIEEYGFHSYIAGTVHDSIVPFTFVEEQEELLRCLLENFAIEYEASDGIPYSGECNVAEVAKGEVWGGGNREVTLKQVKDVEIKKRSYF
ncbi:MAG: DNA polymerase [Bacteroidales bacterium]